MTASRPAPAPGLAAREPVVARPHASLFRPFMPGIEHRTSGEILLHPGYARMRRRYIATTLPNYAVARFPGGWQSAAYRVAALGAIVCLHAAHDAADRATWATLARLKDALALIGLSSPRQIDDLVSRLAGTGHVVLERSAEDGRVRLLRPSDRLVAWDREVMCTYYDALQMLYPGPGYGPAVARDAAFHLAQRRDSLCMLPVIGRFMADNADLLAFHGMYQGVHILMILADAHDPVRESYFNDFRVQFGVSRSHVRNVLLAAEGQGLVERSGPQRRNFGLTARGSAAVDVFIANTLSSHDLAYRLALRGLGRGADGGQGGPGPTGPRASGHATAGADGAHPA